MSFHTTLRNISAVLFLVGVFLWALPIENYISDNWLTFPLLIVGSVGLLLYFVIYFIHTRGN